MSSPTPQCIACREECINFKRIDPHGVVVCYDCIEGSIVPIFYRALEREVEWPVKFTSTVTLEAEQFAEFLGQAFVDRYNRRQQEYRSQNRIYCPHTIETSKAPAVGETSDQLLALTDEQKVDCDSQQIPTETCGGWVTEKRNVMRPATCGRCQGIVTACCGVALRDPWHADTHFCQVQEEDDPLRELIKGKDYQTCPGCHISYQLQEACNHISECPCGTEFCYICGEPATDDSGHWRYGSACPRYGHPDDSRPMFDDEPRPEHQGQEANRQAPEHDMHLQFAIDTMPAELTIGEHGFPLPWMDAQNGMHIHLSDFQSATRRALQAMGPHNFPEGPNWLNWVPLDVEIIFGGDENGLIRHQRFHRYNDEANVPMEALEGFAAGIDYLFDGEEDLMHRIVAELIKDSQLPIERWDSNQGLPNRRIFARDGRPLRWVATTNDNVEQLHIPLHEFLPFARRQFDDNNIPRPDWADGVPISVELVVEIDQDFGINPLGARFIGLEPVTAQAALQDTLREHLESDLRQFFAMEPAPLNGPDTASESSGDENSDGDGFLDQF